MESPVSFSVGIHLTTPTHWQSLFVLAAQALQFTFKVIPQAGVLLTFPHVSGTKET